MLFTCAESLNEIVLFRKCFLLDIFAADAIFFFKVECLVKESALVLKHLLSPAHLSCTARKYIYKHICQLSNCHYAGLSHKAFHNISIFMQINEETSFLSFINTFPTTPF